MTLNTTEKTAKNTKGFTLPEIIIGIAVMLSAILTATNLIVSLTRSNKTNIDDLSAYYLASEGLEAVRNIRDTQWVNNLNWTLDSQFDFWSADGQPLNFAKENGLYIVSRKSISDDFGALPVTLDVDFNRSKYELKKQAPWVVSGIEPNEIAGPKTLLSVYKTGDLEQYMHAQHSTSQLMQQPSIFHRYLKIEPEFDQGSDDQKKAIALTVTSIVTWSSYGQEHEVTLSTLLYNWKDGPA